ncbi:MAG: hypothetical protein J0M04_09250 [Verrucomicrobia bacterium]|nr:hypothetical protein [Verrucomicrobiota bacterium]
MKSSRIPFVLWSVEFVSPGLLLGATLEVGPGKRFERIEQANAAAREGDVVLVHPLANGSPYRAVSVSVNVPKVTFRGVPGSAGGRIVVSGEGGDHSGIGRVPRAIFQFNPDADGCVLEGFDLSGAHNASHNGAGVRIQSANDVTVINCEIHHNDMGVMSNGDGSRTAGANQFIERCGIHHNGDFKEPGQNHNLYLGGAGVTLFGCEVHSSLTGHNVKSRAGFTAVIACHIHHSNNREFDLVDAAETERPGSDALLAGNLIVKDPECSGNRAVIHFGQDGGKNHDGTLTLLNNTIVTPFLSPTVDLSAPGARVRLVGNIVADGGSGQRRMVLVAARNGADLTNCIGTENRLAAGFDPLPPGVSRAANPATAVMGMFADPGRGDYHPNDAAAPLTKGKDLGIAKLPIPAVCGMRDGKFALVWEYQAPANAVLRKDGGAMPGAFAAKAR